MTADRPLDDWLADFELAEQLGAQTHCVTVAATRKRDGRAVLIRALKGRGRGRTAARDALNKEHALLMRLRHPTIPALLDVRQDDDGLALIIADHGGHRLDQVMARVPRPDPLQAMAVGIEVARALSAIHQHDDAHGVVRLDMVEVASDGAVYLHGAGQRHLLAISGAEEELTQLEDMAPEQILGETPDEQTDVFLFGTLLYRLTTGHFPFDPGDGADAPNVSHKIRHSVPEPLGHHISDPPLGLERILRRCLEKRPRDRYPDMASVTSALIRALRARTALPSEHLTTRLLAAAGLSDALVLPRERDVARGTSGTPPWLRRLQWPSAIALAVMAIAFVGWLSLRGDSTGTSSDPRGIVDKPAHLKLLAHPWAEVHIDGKLLDVTPIARPIAVTPGRHSVVFKHPNAPDETRAVEIVAGQTILLDVEMRVVRPPPPPPPAASTEAEDP
jgi:serine/threonine-protein kinase